MSDSTPFALKNLGTPEEYNKRKVALISGLASPQFKRENASANDA
jgi:hypothetical protein